MTYKLNACAKYKEANERVLNNLATKGWEIDRFGHAKKEIDGKLYRYKFQKRTVRKEVQVIHAGTRYSSPSKEWVRIGRLKYIAKK